MQKMPPQSNKIETCTHTSINTKKRLTCSPDPWNQRQCARKIFEKAQKGAKVRARKEGAKSIYLQDVRDEQLLDDVKVSST